MSWWAGGADGSAPAWHAGGRGFESPPVHLANAGVAQGESVRLKTGRSRVQIPPPALFRDDIMEKRANVSDYLLSSLESYFGKDKGRKLAELLDRSGIRCFDDLSMGIPDGLLELAEVDKQSFNAFLEEYGPQAIIKLKKNLLDLSSKMKEFELQLRWARDKLVKEVRVKPLDRIKLSRELSIVSSTIETMMESIQLCCEPYERIDNERASIYVDMIEQVIKKMEAIISDARDYKSALEPILNGFSKLATIINEGIIAEDLTNLLSYSLSAISDVKRLMQANNLDINSILWENILLKSQIFSLLCRKYDGTL